MFIYADMTWTVMLIRYDFHVFKSGLSERIVGMTTNRDWLKTTEKQKKDI